MLVRSLGLRNIRSYRAVDLDFDSGTTLVSGDVGAGKTSLLYAIEMALFGFAEVDPTYLVRHNASTAQVALTLEDEEHRYRFVREFRRKTRRGRDLFELTSSSFSVDGARTNYPPTELRQRVIELLGFPDNPNPRAHSDFWRWAVYIPQERMREVLAQNGEERLATVRKALGVEQYQTAGENAGDVARELRRRSETRTAEAERLRFFEDDLATATAELERHERFRAEFEQAERTKTSERETLDRLVRETQTERLQVESRRGVLEGHRTHLARLRVEVGRRERRVQDLDASISAGEAELAARATAPRRLALLDDEMRSLVALQARLHPHVAALGPLRENLERAKAQHARVRASVAEDEERIQRLQRELESLEGRLKGVDSSGPRGRPAPPTPRSLPELGSALEGVERQLDERLRSTASGEHELEELDALLAEGRCPRCHQAVRPEEFQAHRAELTRELEARQSSLAESRQQRESLMAERASRERYERVLARWEEAEAHRQTLRDSVARTRSDLLAEQGRRLTDAQEVDSLQRFVDATSADLERSALLRDASDQLDRDIALCHQEHRELAQVVDRDANLATEVARLSAERSELTTGLHALDDERRTVDEAIAHLEREMGEMPDVERRLAEASQRLERVHVELQDISAKQASAAALSGSAKQRIETAARGIAERRRLVADAANLERMAAWLSGPFRDMALRLERRLLSRAQADFDRSLRTFFGTLVEDPALVARADSAFGPAVEVEGTWTPPEALSGGERTALALAFRLALGQVVRNLGHLRLSTILLDEPTDGFSPEQVVRLGELLEEIRVPQVIIVSHEPELGGIADRVIRVEKTRGESRIQGSRVRPEEDRASERKPAPADASPRRRKRPAGLSEPSVAPEVSPGTR